MGYFTVTCTSSEPRTHSEYSTVKYLSKLKYFACCPQLFIQINNEINLCHAGPGGPVCCLHMHKTILSGGDIGIS